MRVLLVTPPMVQVNTPYPATAYLCGFLRQHQQRLQLQVGQADASLELFLRLFSARGIARMEPLLRRGAGRRSAPASVRCVAGRIPEYQTAIEPVIHFLQGKDPTLALRINQPEFLPQGPRFSALATDDGANLLVTAFGDVGSHDRAKHLASLFIDDIADAIRDGIDEKFELSRYGERLASSRPTFAPLREALEGPPTLVDEIVDEIAGDLAAQYGPDVVGLTVPFPGNVYGALRIARQLRRVSPHTRIALGGGYVNTELRDLGESALFDYVDDVVVDDGEAPLLALIENLRDQARPLHRTYRRQDGRVRWHVSSAVKEVGLSAAGVPTYQGLPLTDYVSLVEMLNPMHRMWSDGRWNKLTIARGCYWRRCTFCDITLPYIGQYERAPVEELVDRIEATIAETGTTGFHFVDEAAPPAALKAMAECLLRRGVAITWWTNIRFERSFSPDLCQLLARSGCVAVTGGLEAASDRLLALMDKGVTVAQVARVTHAFASAGVMVHAYLMYGFPTETAQETVDALERVRQLFAAGCLQSAFWHRFAATVHSPIGKAPNKYGLRVIPTAPGAFARNELAVVDVTAVDHDALGDGLRRALYNFMLGAGLELDVRQWFAVGDAPPPAWIPPTQVSPELIADALVPG